MIKISPCDEEILKNTKGIMKYDQEKGKFVMVDPLDVPEDYPFKVLSDDEFHKKHSFYKEFLNLHVKYADYYQKAAEEGIVIADHISNDFFKKTALEIDNASAPVIREMERRVNMRE